VPSATSPLSTFDRLHQAIEDGREFLDRTLEMLWSADVPYALIGGKAVAAWTIATDGNNHMGYRPIDLLIHERDASRALAALKVLGHSQRASATQIRLFDGDRRWNNRSIRLAFAGTRIRETDLRPLPTPNQACMVAGYRCLDLPTLVSLLLSQFRRIDQVHVRSLAEVDLINADCLDKLDPTSSQRLNSILEDPHGCVELRKATETTHHDGDGGCLNRSGLCGADLASSSGA
jgi:hypothetical protein